MSKIWQLQEAKAHFSEVVERAKKGEPQVVTKHGENAVVVLDYKEYQQLRGRKRTLLEVLQAAPDIELDIVRDKTPIKPFEFDLE